MRRAVIQGTGAYLPARVLTNQELSTQVDTNDEWIRERTGICQRHIAAEGEFTSDLATNAAKEALKNSGVAVAEIDLLIVATSTPDDTIPATATRVQQKLGMKQGAAFDINAVCSGFVYAVSLADAYLTAGKAKTALIIGAETFSRVIDWKDRSTCILFGDGAGAVVLRAEEDTGTAQDRGVLYTQIASDGEYGELLYTDGGVSRTQRAGVLHMQGKEVFRHAVAKMGDSVEAGLEKIGLTNADINWLVPHQANARILQATAKRLNVDENRVILTVDNHANTSAASIPLALACADKAGKFKKGNLIATPALGAGLTWGTCLIRW